MGFIVRVAGAAFAGAVIAWVATALVLDAVFARGGYTREALVELPPWAFGVIGGGGGLIGSAGALLAGRSPLPAWLRPAVLGSLAGVAAVVAASLFVAASLGGPSSKGQAPYLHNGLVYGVPVGLAAGAVTGIIVGKRRRAVRGASSEGGSSM